MIHHPNDVEIDSYLPRLLVSHSVTVECAETDTVTDFIHALNETRKSVPVDQFDTCTLDIGEEGDADCIGFYLPETDEEYRQRRTHARAQREFDSKVQRSRAVRRLEQTWSRADEYSVVVPELEALVIEAELALVQLVMPLPERPRNPRLL